MLGADARDRAAISWAPGWRIPLGGALLLLCGGLAMIGFPLDDVWHRIFGQDVTLWGPTHVLMIGGASLAPIAAWLLLVEGRCAVGKPGPGRLLLLAWEVQLAGAALIGLSTLQLEFGYGVPQFQLAFHPILIALAASVGLVAARVRLGRGGALAAVGAYLLVMVPMVLIIGPGLDHTFMHFPLYIVEAVLVELAALALRGPVRLGIGAGVLIGTVGVAAEWAWTQIAFPLPWNAVAAARGAAARARRGGRRRAHRRAHRRRPALAAASGDDAATRARRRARRRHRDAGDPHAHRDRAARARVRDARRPARGDRHRQARSARRRRQRQVVPRDVVAGRRQPPRRSCARRVRAPTARPSRSRSTASGRRWSACTRARASSRCRSTCPATPRSRRREVPAEPQFARAFVADHEVLRREETGDAAPWLGGLAYGILGMVALAWLLAIGAAVTRFERRVGASALAGLRRSCPIRPRCWDAASSWR